MAIDRRSLLQSLGAAIGAALLPRAGRAADAALYVSACADAAGGQSVALFTADGALRFATRLPDRGHDSVLRPGGAEFVTFARRPGNWAAVVEAASGRTRRTILSPEGRHFYGHGAFSADGRLLYATENAMATGDGVLGLYDATDGYRRIGELPSFGIGPHDLAFRPGGTRLVVANGGLRTHPDTGREILNPDSMAPSLAVIDTASGECLDSQALGPALQGLSIRHLALAPDGTAVFGCQWQGDPFDLPPLVGILPPDGAARFLEMPEDDLASLQNYVGSVGLDAAGAIAAATSPIGGVAAFWDLEDGRYLGRRALSDVCGVAPVAEAGAFLLTSGNAGVQRADLAEPRLAAIGAPALNDWSWDNHVLLL